jgi:glycosyltransferase involved in cell wall biosynthesis
MSKKKLKIAIVSKLWEETSTLSRGGTGASIGYLVNGLVDRGHQVTLFATGNSKTKAQKLISIRKKHYQGDYSEIHEYANIASAFRLADKFDIIHCAVEQKSVIFGELTSTPSLHSIRYGEFFDHEIDLLKNYSKLNYVGNSKALKKKLPFLNWQGTIYNGLDLNDFIRKEKHQGYLLYLARLSPQKGIDVAIRAAKRLKLPLLIAGKTSKTDEAFLNKEVFPFIDGKQIKYLGEVLGQNKKNLLANAFALIHPNIVFEACSNSILEAMASNVPVIAYDNGSNKELIKDGKTGFIVKNEKELIVAIKKLDKISRHDCYLRVKENFSLEKMITDYEDLYYKLIKKGGRG